LWWIIVVSIFGGLIVLGILILSIPFDLAFQFHFYNKPDFSLRWSWIFGILSRDLKFGKLRPKKPRHRQKFALIEIIDGVRAGSQFLQIKGLIGCFIKLIKGIFRAFKIRDLDIEFQIGLDDPSETFYIFAIAEPFNWLLSRVQPYPIRIRPSFIGPIFEGFARGSIRIYPIMLMPPMFQFVFSRPVLKLIRKIVAKKWRRNR
jgi:hypothetical protein